MFGGLMGGYAAVKAQNSYVERQKRLAEQFIAGGGYRSRLLGPLHGTKRKSDNCAGCGYPHSETECPYCGRQA